MIPDPVGKQVDLFSEGQKDLGFGDHELEIVAVFIHELGFTDDEVAIEARRIIKGITFAVGSRSENPAWKEHTAILREFCEHWNNKTAILNKVKQIMGRRQDHEYESIIYDKRERIEGLCGSIVEYYSYFCAISHHRKNTIIQKWWRITGGTSKPGEEAFNDSNFLQVVRKFFSDIVELSRLVSVHKIETR